MDEQLLQKYSKYSIATLFLILIALSLYIILSFVTALITAAIIVYVFYPGFKKLNKHIKSKGICSLIMVVAVLLIIIGPLFLVINALFIEAASFYKTTKNIDLSPLSNIASRFLVENIDINLYIKDFTTIIVSFLIRLVSDFFFSLPQKVLVLFVIVFVMYYFFKDGDKIVGLFEKIFPMRSDHRSELIKEFHKVINATLYGVLVSSVIQGVVGTLGLVIFDVSSPIIWGSVMVLTAMIPFIGTWIVWLPAALFKIFNGELFNGFGLLLYGLLIVSLIDNFIKPRLISGKSQIHPVLIILGVFGGLKAFGLIGVMIGPLLLGTLSVIYTFYAKKSK